MLFTETMLESYATPIGKTEDEKCKHAITMIRDALAEYGYADDSTLTLLSRDTSSYVLNMRSQYGEEKRNVKLLVQGSYANKTNIPSESDVDVAVVLTSTFWSEYPIGITKRNYGFTDSNDSLEAFKNDIEQILRNKFRRGVQRHNKSIEVKGNSYRVDADTVPCGEFRDYRMDDGTNVNRFIPGIRIQPDDKSAIIINYPVQHIKNGVLKNDATDKKFKKMVRIAKNIRVLMEDMGIDSAKRISSFLIESLLWNVPDKCYKEYTLFLRFMFAEVLSYLFKNIDSIYSFKEINGIKDINKDDVTRIETCKAFIKDLYSFYDYNIEE